MALGRPAITTPRVLDLRAVQDAMQAARQRIEALEKYVGTLPSSSETTTPSASAAEVALLRASITALSNTLDALDDRVAVAEANIVDLMGDPVTFGDVVLYDHEGRTLLAGGQAITVS